MSARDSPSPHGAYTAKAAKRRANSCVPCRVSKSRCSGGIPCSTCQKKRGKPRCWYRNVVSKDDEDSENSKTSPFDQEQKEDRQTTAQQELDDAEDEQPSAWPRDIFYGAFSLARCVDKFKSLSLADGAADDVIMSVQTIEGFSCKFSDEERARILDQMEPGHAASGMSLPSLLVPDPDRLPSGHLRSLYHKIKEARQLLDAGMVAEAWSASASLLRDAELLELDDDDDSEKPPGRQADREAGRRIWWLLVDLDAYLSFIVGRRPLISPSHGVPRPNVDWSRQEEKDLLENILDFSQYMLEVLGDVIPARSPGKTECTVDKATLESYLHRLQDLHSGFSYLPQNGKTDSALWTAIAEHQFKVQLFLMVLNCHIVMAMASGRSQKPSEGRSQSASKPKRPQPLRKHSSKGYLDEMFQSVRRITSLFEYINALDPSPIPPWPRCVGVFCAVCVLGIARLRQDIEGIQTDTDRIQELLKFFQGTLKRSPRSAIAQAAVMSLGNIVEGLQRADEQQHPSTVTDGVAEPRGGLTSTLDGESSQPLQSRSFSTEAPVDNTGSGHGQPLKRPLPPARYEEDVRPEKRLRYSVMPPSYENSVHANTAAWQSDQGPPPYGQAMSSFSEMSAASFHESSVQHSFEQASLAHSAVNSFNANDQLQYASFGYANGPPDNATQFPFWMHPPMMIHPPMYHAGWQAMDPNLWMIPDTGQQAFYAGPPPIQVGDPRQHDSNGPTSQSATMNNYAQGAGAAREEAQATGHMAMPADISRAANDAQFYATTPVQYQRLDHPASSPIRDDGLAHQDNAFGRPTPMDRRRSAADIRSHAPNGTWTMEMSADFASQTPVADPREPMHASQTPSRDGLLSPVSETEPKSRRNSATPRQIAWQGRPPPAPQHVDIPGPNIDAGDVNGLRRRSIAHVGDMMMPDVVSSGGDIRTPEHSEPRNEQHQRQQQQQQQQQQQPVWQSQAPNPSPGGHNPSPGSNMYSLDMAGHAHVMQYEQPFDPHLPPRPIVTTGPFTGNSAGHHWWPR
ncbi:hypothetical protein A1O1_07062 [Capronia coronata CBS 617.96]|uniref:Zn(2)-C6 fungal-type domain-containing protein n=1 Tax=Capronia coronata CBS 617.96 TaxID=1182541 RepID=W9YMF0_9EURO|nr:uncharacterized protein A1O1_07062 [Capronia coronata CBS 617.96]EXJ83439.1 hypothetical protein A1O1_07062 [Capronia coronata CBS 617.96]